MTNSVFAISIDIPEADETNVGGIKLKICERLRFHQNYPMVKLVYINLTTF